MKQIVMAQKVREILSSYREAEDLINIGAYVKGSKPQDRFCHQDGKIKLMIF